MMALHMHLRIKPMMPLQIRMRIKNGEQLPVEYMKIPMIDLPLGATEDRVCGTIDIEKALTEGAWRFYCWLLMWQSCLQLQVAHT